MLILSVRFVPKNRNIPGGAIVLIRVPKIRVGELIDTIEYDYPTFHLSMDCSRCEIIKRNLVLKEAEDARWLTKDQFYDVKWLPTDITLIGIIEKCL